VTPDLSWNWSPFLLLALGSYLAVYLVRWRNVRHSQGSRGASVWRLLAFVAGIAALFAALVTPLDVLGEQLFVGHMSQHILLVDLGPILLLAGLTKVILRPITARLTGVERRAGILMHPAAAVVFYAGTLWLWHVPAMYQLALRHPAVHAFQHLHFFSAGLLFWWHAIAPIRPRWPLTGLAVVGYMAITKLFTGVLASLVTFSPVGFYDFYARQPRYWDLSATQDQGMAGALMMTEELIVMTTAVALLFIRMLGQAEEQERRRERFGEA
jgi:putative membrane protein